MLKRKRQEKMLPSAQQAEIDRQNAITMVVSILRSPIFLAYGTEQQKAVLDQIIATGELSSQDVYRLFQEETNQYNYLENLPYNVFVNIIDSGEIKGRDLVHLCNSSSKLRAMCLKTREFVDLQGKVYSVKTEYVYRRVLEQLGILVGPNEHPSEIYAKLSSSYQLWDYVKEPVMGMLPGGIMLPIAGVNNQPFRKVKGSDQDFDFVKQVIKANHHTLFLDTLGNVWGYGYNNYLQLGLGGKLSNQIPNRVLNRPGDLVDPPVQVPNLSNIVQIAGIDTFSVALDSDGNVFTCGLTSPAGLPDSNYFDGILNPNFVKLSIPPEYGKIVKISVSVGVLTLINDRHQAFIFGDNRETMSFDNIKFVNQTYEYITLVTESNFIIYGNQNNVLTSINIRKAIKKAIFSYNTITILYEDGTLSIIDTDFKTAHQLQYNNLKFIEVDVSGNVGYAVAEDGSLYKFRAIVAQTNLFGLGNLPLFGVLEPIPGISNVVQVSASQEEELALLVKNPSIFE
jgi:hypothetical protein